MVDIAIHNVKEIYIRKIWNLEGITNTYSTQLTFKSNKEILKVVVFSDDKSIMKSFINGKLKIIDD